MINMKYKKIIVVFVLAVGILGCAFVLFLNASSTNVSAIDDLEITEKVNCEEAGKKIEFYVDVKGAVKKPGVYKVEEGMIVSDVINLAGGITSSGTTNNINLSKKVTDEMIIYVYKKSELTTKPQTTTKVYIPDYCENYFNTNSNSNTLVNINTATKDEIMNIPGIGEAKALSIIEYRQNNRFNSIEDIKNVSGIGDALFAKIKDYITV